MVTFEVGQEVKHTVFGLGKVIRVEQRGEHFLVLVTIEFSDGKSRRILGDSDKLKKVE